MTVLREDFTLTRRVPPPAVRGVRKLVVLGDSTAVGIGDPAASGGWRGVGPLLADALGVEGPAYLNTSVTGARMRCVRESQLDAALTHRPDVAVLIVGMNDTLRSDFDADEMAADLDAVVTTLAEAGTAVLTVRFHDHGKVFRLPGPIRRALRARIDELNGVIDGVCALRGTACLDLVGLPGAYDLDTWSVDRLHPSERGHRMLALGFADLLHVAGFAVPNPVTLECSGGAVVRRRDHLGWLVAKGLPWLWRRSSDLLPYAASILARSALETLTRRAEDERTHGLPPVRRHPAD